MFRLLLALSVIFFNLEACRNNFNSCKRKILDSKSILKTDIQLPIKKHTRLIFSKTTPKFKILKYDPFLSLYLVEDKKGFRYPFYIAKHHNSVASIGLFEIKSGKIVKKQIGLDHFATFSKKVDTPALLLDSACGVNGMVTPKGIIEKEYINRFLKIKNVSYSDVGIRVKNINNKTIVDRVDPFVKNNLFVKNDTILEFDSKKVKDSATLMRWILFSKIGSIHTFKVKRDSHIIKIDVKTYKRYGGGYISDTFLEFLGIYFDKDLKIVKIDERAKKYQLKLGDRFVKLYKDHSKVKSFLFQRDGFDFFVKF